MAVYVEIRPYNKIIFITGVRSGWKGKFKKYF